MQSGLSSYKYVKCVKRPIPCATDLAFANGPVDTPFEKALSWREPASTAGGSVSPNVIKLMQKIEVQVHVLIFEL